MTSAPAMDLPEPLTAWVAAKNAHDVEGQVACFAPDGEVDDEDEVLVGTDQIRTWAQRVTDAYDLTVTPSGWTAAAGGSDAGGGGVAGAGVLTAMVSGDFPGSPLEFRYHLTLADGLITSLRTEA